MEFIKCLGVKSCRNVRWPLMLSMVTIFHGLALGDERGHVYDSWQFKDHRTQINLTSLAIQNHHHGIVIGNIYPDHMSWTQALRPSSGRYNKVPGRYKTMYTTCLGMKLDQVDFQSRWGPTSRPMVLLYIIYLNGRSVIRSLEVIAPSPCRLATAEIWVCCSLSFHHGPGPQMLPAVALSWLCLRGLEVDWRLLCLDRCQSCL